MGDLRGLVNDPDFTGLPAAQQRDVLARASGDASFNSLSDADVSQFVSKAKGASAKPSVSPQLAAAQTSPQALANKALAGTGINVGPVPTPQVQPQFTGNPVTRFLTAAGATLPVATPYKSAPMDLQGRSREQLANLPGPTDAYNMIAQPAQRIGSGDVAGGLGQISGAAAQAYILKKAGEAVQSSIPESNLQQSPSPVNKVLPSSVEELTGTTPERIAELKSFPEKVESIRQTAVAAEKQAHQAASNAFPKFDKPIETGRMLEVPAQGPIEMTDFGEVAPTTKVPETTTFRDLQEQRSNLLSDIADEKRLVARGATPRFDLADMYQKLNDLDATMNKAALDQGGQEGLNQLQAAREQYAKYMNDFHGQGSPIKPLLDAKPGQVNKVISHFLSPDSGSRAIQTLQQYGVDTSPIQNMLGQGDRPLRVAVNESTKLAKAGSPEAYTIQRIKESISQAKTNEMPSSAQARLPASAMKSKYPLGVVNEIPGAEFITPRKLTAFRLQQALKAKMAGRK